MRFRACAAVCLVLKRENEILISLRQNTGYRDGEWGLVSGHVEEGEGIIDAIIRETKEEADIEVERNDLKVVHVIYSRDVRDDFSYINFFVTCEKYSGEIRNAEPYKCGGLRFCKYNKLPINTVDMVKIALKNIEKGILFTEINLTRTNFCHSRGM